MKDGMSITLHEDDIVHIPSRLPRQILLPDNKGQDFVYFVIKIQEE